MGERGGTKSFGSLEQPSAGGKGSLNFSSVESDLFWYIGAHANFENNCCLPSVKKVGVRIEEGKSTHGGKGQCAV